MSMPYPSAFYKHLPFAIEKARYEMHAKMILQECFMEVIWKIRYPLNMRGAAEKNGSVISVAWTWRGGGELS